VNWSRGARETGAPDAASGTAARVAAAGVSPCPALSQGSNCREGAGDAAAALPAGRAGSPLAL